MTTPDAKKARSAERQQSQTELEMQAGRRTIQRRAARLGLPVAPKGVSSVPTIADHSEQAKQQRKQCYEPKVCQPIGERQPLIPRTQGKRPPTNTRSELTVAAEASETAVAKQSKLSVDTNASIEFLKERATTHPLWHPQLSFKGTDPRTGEEANGFETASFPRDAHGNPDWDSVRGWVQDRQGRGNIYWTINAAKVMNRKPTKKDIVAVVALHADLDPRADEDETVAEERLARKIEGYHHTASIVISSGCVSACKVDP